MTEEMKSEVDFASKTFFAVRARDRVDLAVPATLMTATEAEARVGQPLSPVSVAGAARRADRRYKKKKMKASPDAQQSSRNPARIRAKR